jgi:hypothetical protein
MSALGLAAIQAAPDIHRDATGEYETILPSQFIDLLRNDHARPPEHRLMLAVLEDAIRSYRRYMGSSRARRGQLFREVEEWFASDAATWPFSFVVICQTFDIEPEYIRAGLRAWSTANASVVRRDGPTIRFRIRDVSGSRHQVGGAHIRTPSHLLRASRRRT